MDPIKFQGEKRADGSCHFKSGDLPGFHFVIGPDEELADFQDAFIAALTEFMPRYLEARLRAARRRPALKITRSLPHGLTAELELA
jgi:hypothetical protein